MRNHLSRRSHAIFTTTAKNYHTDEDLDPGLVQFFTHELRTKNALYTAAAFKVFTLIKIVILSMAGKFP
jgi:hypothetical protein